MSQAGFFPQTMLMEERIAQDKKSFIHRPDKNIYLRLKM